ncbi:OmpA family protein [Mesonia aquimarina]|uniref:OmpA family protein n=1 Tax=Mesonia aquimarina TaxID=1504967 RepID=UPI000EF5C9AA|nr:OmpA family protein [Mesonia aquimarina]
MYFVSTRNKSNKNDKWSNQPYLDIYKVNLGEKEPTEVKGLNTKYHDGPVAVSSDATMMIFSRDGHKQGLYKEGQKRVKVAQQGLYLAKKVEGKWEYVKPLSINSSNYSVSHPSISSDGKTLYFSSDMPGGFGDTDIWKASLDGATVGTPENLGASVNTPAKEGFPSIEEDILYFSTNGMQGLGGFDVYKKDLTKTSAAVNLGRPVNTNKDDFSFSMKAGADFGYFASNRSGVDNIYKALAICKSEVIAVVKNSETGKKLSEVVITITDAMGNTLGTESSDVNGEVSFAINCETAYMLVASADSYKTLEVQVSPTTASSVEEELLLSPVNEMITEKEVKLDNIYFEFDKSFITERGSKELDKLVKIMKDNPSMHILVKSHTDSKGNASYNLKLSEERAQSTVQYLISKGIAKDRLSGKGMGSTDLKIDCTPNCTDEENAKNRRSEFIIVKK